MELANLGPTSLMLSENNALELTLRRRNERTWRQLVRHDVIAYVTMLIGWSLCGNDVMLRDSTTDEVFLNDNRFLFGLECTT